MDITQDHAPITKKSNDLFGAEFYLNIIQPSKNNNDIFGAEFYLISQAIKTPIFSHYFVCENQDRLILLIGLELHFYIRFQTFNTQIKSH
jgi:hypothetical protein